MLRSFLAQEGHFAIGSYRGVRFKYFGDDPILEVRCGFSLVFALKSNRKVDNYPKPGHFQN